MHFQSVFSSIIFLISSLTLFAQSPQKGVDILGEYSEDFSGHSICMPDVNTIAVGAPQNYSNGTAAGHIRVYSWNGSSWMQKGNDIDGEALENNEGWSLSMPTSNTLAAGAMFNDNNGINAGQVRIFDWNGNNWIQRGIGIQGDTARDHAGYSVSMPDSNTIAIGARSSSGNDSLATGQVRIFSWNGNNWIQKGAAIYGEYSEDQSSWSMSMPDSNTIAIGSPFNYGNGSNAGHVRIYSWDGSNWIQKGTDIDGENSGDRSGFSVNMPDSNTIAIGAIWHNVAGTSTGHARIFQWDGSSWSQKGTDIEGIPPGENFGYKVDMPDSNTVAISAPNNHENGTYSGVIRVFHWDGNNWIKKIPDLHGKISGFRLGYSVSMPNSKIVAVGAPYFNSNSTDPPYEAGYVSVFHLTGVYGNLFQDFNQNCIKDSLEIPLTGQTLVINPGNIIVQTDAYGTWHLDSLPIGNYTITVDTTNPNWLVNCLPSQSFTVIHADSLTHAADFGFYSSQACPSPSLSINTPFLRPGFSNQKVYVQVCNDALGTINMNGVFVVVKLDSLLTIDSSSIPYTTLGNNQYQINLSNSLFPGQCVNFWLDCTLSTNAILGQTLCMQANSYPVDSCILDTIADPFPLGTVSPCTTAWDRSSLMVEGSCVGDSVRFVIYNMGDLGDGDMSCFAPIRVYLDGQYILLDSIQLNGGDSTVFIFAGNGQTWRLEADQHPLHPGNSQPNASVELCGDPTNWTSELINILPHDDADPIRDIFCVVVRGSYDPNDKRGFPLGVGTNHNVQANQDLEYMIRFQNTGTDTAFTVVIRDTLPEELNIFTVESGVSSHSYSFRMYGPRVLEWRFDNILLPDSTSNEAESNGFVTFKVRQNPDLPIGTLIENNAGIYFDFNEPVITNYSQHTIYEPGLLVSSLEETNTEEILPIQIYPNPTKNQITIDFGVKQKEAKIHLLGLDGRSIKVLNIQASSTTQLELGDLPQGLYLLEVQVKNQNPQTFKVSKF